MITFGLTGGIACGKSTVTKVFARHSIPIVDADVVAREVVIPGTRSLKAIVTTFGDQMLLSDGTLDRTKLGTLVFQDKHSMFALNLIMGPAIQEESARQLQAFHDRGHQIVGYDAALICEMGNAGKYRPLIVVYCSRDTQIERLMKRNSLTREQAVARIDAQMPVEQKVKMADHVIYTWGTIEESNTQTELLIEKLKQMDGPV